MESYDSKGDRRRNMKDYQKYSPQYYPAPAGCFDWIQKEYISQPPRWCSVDLRDGNQALIVPMTLEQKLNMFEMLVEIGFKDIEVGFPAASETEFNFVRTLIEEKRIPKDVTIQVLTQAREHIIQKTFEAVKGCENVIIHVYNSTSVAQREQVFQKSKEEIKEIAIKGARLLLELTKEGNYPYGWEYSPESFTGTEPEYALEVCNAVLDVWKPDGSRRVIINLPSTVQLSMPHIFASQVEYMHKFLKYREYIEISIHPHNDRGSSVSDAELGVLAGADRVEGTLFGNGERTGNVDLITLGMNLYTHGVDPGLHFDNILDIVQGYEENTGMQVDVRTPYAGRLVFAAFSGSHQDAIAKGMKYHAEQSKDVWSVPYLPLNPQDINSQSGKGGVGYILERHYGLHLPPKMREDFGYRIKDVSDTENKELTPTDIFSIFIKSYEDATVPYSIHKMNFNDKSEEEVEVVLTTSYKGEEKIVKAIGNGRLNAVSNGIKQAYGLTFDLISYGEHALEQSSSSRAIAYVGIKGATGKIAWGAGVHQDIMRASVKAFMSSVNNLFKG